MSKYLKIANLVQCPEMTEMVCLIVRSYYSSGIGVQLALSKLHENDQDLMINCFGILRKLQISLPAKKDLAPLLVLVTTKVYEPCEEIPFCMYSNSASSSVVVAYGYGSWIRVSIYHLMLENCVNGPSFDNVAMLLILSRCIFSTLTLGWALFQKVI